MKGKVVDLLRNLSIARKLMLIMMFTVVVTITLVFGAFAIADLVIVKRSILDKLAVLADVVGQNSAAALLFNDRHAAAATLTALKAEAHITAACIYTDADQVFVEYTPGASDVAFPSTVPNTDSRAFERGALTVFHRIIIDGDHIGTVYIRSHTAELYSRRKRYLINALVALGLSTLVAFSITLRLQRVISVPVTHLVEMAKQVSAHGDYSIRATSLGNDELGILVEEFNHMLDQIRDRDIALAMARDELEERVAARTAELRELHEELIRKQKLATMGQLIGTVSHELRNPLNAIRTSVYSLNERMRDVDVDVEKPLRRIERNIVRCAAIIEELLDYTRTRDINRDTIDVNEWIREIVDDHAVPDGITIEVDVGGPDTAFLDEERMRRCVINLLNNAIQALQEHAVATGRIVLTTRSVNNMLEICVSDNGPGIQEDDLARIFEPLFSTKSFGVGLGLPLVKQIINRHGGTITVENAAAGGVAVTMRVPCDPPAG